MSPYKRRNDRQMMRRALALAGRGAGYVSPNPQVGAVVVRKGEIVAEGYHHRVGADHAEIDALKKIDFKARGLEMYVSLEPCSYQGRTPPCADALIRSGIRRLYVAMVDPNPMVAGRGIRRLRKAGIEVELGLMENEARRLNETFIKHVSSGRPFVVAKAAMSLDGRIATSIGDSGQKDSGISGEAAHRYVQRLRRDLDGILVGGQTVLKDNPRLTCRLSGPVRQPLRIVLDGQGISPHASRVFDPQAAPSILATTRVSSADWRKKIEDRGCEVWLMPGAKGIIDIDRLLLRLGERQIGSLLVEGGSGVLASFSKNNAIDRYDLIYSPRMIGGEGIPLIGSLGITRLCSAPLLDIHRTRRMGDDLLLQAYPRADVGSGTRGKE